MQKKVMDSRTKLALNRPAGAGQQNDGIEAERGGLTATVGRRTAAVFMERGETHEGKSAEGRGLYRPEFEHDACGIGAVVDIQGRASHETVDDALKIVEKLEHRGGQGCRG